MTDRRKNAREAVKEPADAGREAVDAAASAAQDATVVGLDGVRRATEQVTQALGIASQKSEAVAHQASENLGALAETSTVLAHGMQDVSREWLKFSQHGLQKNIEGLTQLARCRSIPDLVAAQTELMRNNWHYMIDVSRWAAQCSIEIMNEAAEKIGNETKQPADRTRRAA